ncbi:ferredoxin [Desulfosarcina ovata subsp. sediminis]|uniref:Ferredoxin n=1 Tax=Desulfosarcina ovata subsp. sediminis TaxID=885957 RepID=A0A5K7ZZ77_9BACT|nr:ASKHA domain-containing protein [Desulfosarcina ovata]BBO85410.1 ferredoxin [Desulfosarcina ovata subsp. sediminis]
MTTTHRIQFLPHNREIEVKDGENLIRAAMEAGVHINASCGGEGVCGKCRVIVEAGEVTGGISEKLSAADQEKGYRLACRSLVHGDLTIRVPVESAIDASVLNQQTVPRRTARIQQKDLNDLKEAGLFLPPVEKIYLTLPEPDNQDHLPDVTRLVSHLKLHHNEHRLTVSLPVIRKLPDVLRKDGFKVTATLARPVMESGKTEIVNVQPGDTSERNYAIAMDIGTTTIYGQLIDLKSGEVLAEHGDFNGQISYGEDVISRIVYAEKEGGLERLHQVVAETINTIIKKIVRRAKVDAEDIAAITLAGNTTMTQLLLKVNPRYIRRSPYVPASTLYPPIRAVDIGLAVDDHVTALVYPAVSSYAGGDIVAGVMGAGLYLDEQLTLFMDIGTNAEIVIGNRDWLACAACSAGPAFEGGGIKHGMRAAKGAIEDFSLDPVTWEPMLMTIGNVRPKGICGSGLIIMTAVMFEMGLINNLGKFNRDLPTPRLREDNGVWEYVLAWNDETQIDNDIALTEIDIENLIRAKGAIYSGCMTLLTEVGMGMQDLDRIVLAGGFGSYVDLEKAMTIGLLPEIDPEKVTFIGNSSLMGAKMSSLTNRIRRDVVEVTRNMTNFELSETPSYMDNYVAALFLPHTDLNHFPRLKTRLADRKKNGEASPGA